jgi:membrane AbrB-like protein
LPAGALAIGFAAALACEALHVPLPWMIGPMLAIATVRICGLHVTAPRGGRQAGQWIIGTALGLYFTPTVVEHVGSVAWMLTYWRVVRHRVWLRLQLSCRRRRHRQNDGALCECSGGVAEMTVLASALARASTRAAAQSLRIRIVTACRRFRAI